ncbi:anaphase-promoting complex subunit 2 [Musca domestica]|uniref:Anaphase-promoting complex subunit 2 n=1 Tax=Musca domestica TaxID=7370 RepID=A0A1I8NG42_MUSDO|nr:anaphase-promoting complex subunit 2 [Musca domestica]
MEIVWSDFSESCPILKECLDSSDLAKETEDTLEYIYEVLWIEIGSFVRSKLAPTFWSCFKHNQTLAKFEKDGGSAEALQQQYKLFTNFVNAVKSLDAYYQFVRTSLEKLDGICQRADHGKSLAKLNELLRSALLSQLPTHFNNVVYSFYSVSFRVFFNLHQSTSMGQDNEDLDESGMPCKGCNQELEKCQCQSLLQTINEVNQKLVDLELLDRLAGQSMTFLVQQRIKEHIKNTCHGIFDRSHLKNLLTWLEDVVICWLMQVFHSKVSADPDAMHTDDGSKSTDVIQSLKVKLTFYVYENYALSVIDQFFSIIIDFPDSIPAIEDLKICMEKINLRRQIINTLKSSLEARILHPGVNTMDILTGYVAAIKAIRYLDSSGVILETVTAPIKEYLRKRSDTVRCVVTSLTETESGPTDLSEELAKGDAVKDGTKGNVNDELSNWENWQPDPFGLDNTVQTRTVKTSRSADIISMVVDIYGSKELFMSEYRNLLADRLLTQLEFNPEKEIRNLELLKLRFGESLLHNCEVMLKDIADSKRINSHIHSDTKYVENKQFDISSLIISAQFWPSFNKESVELPEEIANEFQKYTKSYEEYKGNRTLNWRTVTGKVAISIELGDRVLDMTVAPTQAVIIYHFQNKNEWSLDDLSTLVKIPPSVLRRRMAFWQSHGIIIESQPGIYKLIEDELPKSQLEKLPINEIITEDEDNESAMASASDQREEELQVFWSYIVGMLTNLDSLPIERIHQMLKLFASNGLGVEFTQDDLKDFLQRKVRDHKLIYSGGVYQLAK